MKLLRRFTTATMLLAATATMASAQTVSAQNSGQNDSVDYAPSVRTVAGPLPLNTQYSLEVSAPTQLNKKGEEALPSGIRAELRVNVASYPEGSTPDAALALVSVDPASMVFYSLGEKQKTTVKVAAAANTTPGDYMYNIQAVAEPGLGWGISSHTLTVTVSQPVVLDMTPPDVTITSPKAGLNLEFCTGGTTVPVTISAVDAESPVTAVWFKVNGTELTVNPFVSANAVVAEGQFVAAAVGAYELGAWARSAGGPGHSPVVGVSVNYKMSWLPPVSAGRTLNGAVPIKFAAKDCQGKFVADKSVRVEVWEGTVQRFAAVYGDGSDAVRINEIDEHYIANFQPPSGSHTYTVKVFFNGFEQARTTVNTR
jgi:Bacterial Ig domain